jgi:type III secretion system FlhB-like substrate exporter
MDANNYSVDMLKRSAFVDEINNVLKIDLDTCNDPENYQTIKNIITYLQTRIDLIDKLYKK